VTCATIAAISMHLVRCHSANGYSGKNPGIYAQMDCGLTAGVVRNSQRRVSAYGAWTFESDRSPAWASIGVAMRQSAARSAAEPSLGRAGSRWARICEWIIDTPIRLLGGEKNHCRAAAAREAGRKNNG